MEARDLRYVGSRRETLGRDLGFYFARPAPTPVRTRDHLNTTTSFCGAATLRMVLMTMLSIVR